MLHFSDTEWYAKKTGCCECTTVRGEELQQAKVTQRCELRRVLHAPGTAARPCRGAQERRGHNTSSPTLIFQLTDKLKSAEIHNCQLFFFIYLASGRKPGFRFAVKACRPPPVR